MFTAATGLAILHVLDDAFIGKQPGTTAGDHLLAAGALLVVLGGSIVLYSRLRPVLGPRLRSCSGSSSPRPARCTSCTPWSTKRSDFTGMLAMIGGVAPGKLGAHSQVPIGPASR